jgi:glycosyltransferase involved in cell wall biosynthesis
LVEAGIPIQNSQIIYTGVNVEPFLLAKSYSDSNKKQDYFELIYAGRLCAEKGVDTAIKAIGYLIRRFGLEKVVLSLAGNGTPDYMRKLQFLVAQEHLEEHIHFLGRVPGEKMPSLLSRQDVLILPSVWPEPFARIALEGMISGLVVIATPCGGTSEIVEEGVNGLFFSPGDASDLAEKIFTLYKDPDLRFNLSHAGQCTVMENFTYSKMMNKIENYLHEVWQTSKIEESL